MSTFLSSLSITTHIRRFCFVLKFSSWKQALFPSLWEHLELFPINLLHGSFFVLDRFLTGICDHTWRGSSSVSWVLAECNQSPLQCSVLWTPIVSVFLDAQLYFLNSWSPLALPRFPFLSPWFGNSLKAVNWSGHRAHLVYLSPLIHHSAYLMSISFSEKQRKNQETTVFNTPDIRC